MRLIGEVTGFSGLRSPAIYFELRDGEGAVSCAMWRTDYDRLGLPDGSLRDGVEVIVAGGPEFFPGGGESAPRFSFRATHLRPAGEGDLLARLEALRRKLAAEGMFAPQKELPRPFLPRRIGLITGRESAALADVVAGLRRRGWGGELVCAHPPVQGARAAPAIVEALTALAGLEGVETIVVARGGGSLADLWCFCDETLCRGVALLGAPVISAVGHETDRTLIDEVAACACSTPTHAVEAAVRVEVDVERDRIGSAARGLSRLGAAAVAGRAAILAAAARGLTRHAARERSRLHQLIREMRAAASKQLAGRDGELRRRALVLARRVPATRAAIGRERLSLGRAGIALRRRRSSSVADRLVGLRRLEATLAAHQPERVLERGYAIISDRKGEVIASAAAARAQRRLRVRFSDDDLEAEVRDDE